MSLSTDDFVTGSINTFGGAIPGIYTSTADLGLIGAAYPGLNKVLYTFLGDGFTFNGSLQIGLVMHTGLALDRDDNVGTPDSNDAGLGNPYQSLIRDTMYTTTSYDPSLIFTVPSAPISAQAFQLAGIPEPSTVLLGAVGALGLLRRRRDSPEADLEEYFF